VPPTPSFKISGSSFGFCSHPSLQNFWIIFWFLLPPFPSKFLDYLLVCAPTPPFKISGSSFGFCPPKNVRNCNFSCFCDVADSGRINSGTSRSGGSAGGKNSRSRNILSENDEAFNMGSPKEVGE